MSMFPVQKSDLVACAQRELEMRQKVYPRWVESGRMKQAKADHEIDCMTAIIAALQEHYPND